MKYILGDFIGKGSFGKIYELIDEKKKEKKIIKFIILSYYGIDNYLEPYILLNLKNKNIFSAQNILIENKILKIIGDKANCDLRSIIGKIKNKKNLLLQLTNGINYLHSKNILHGDIKPENILKFDKTYKFSDFGYSKVMIHNYTNYILYSKKYRPPEIYNYRCYLKSDIWALGCTFYEILTNSSLFKQIDKDLIKINNLSKENKYYYLINLMTSTDIEKRLNYKQLCENFDILSEKFKPIKFDLKKIYQKYQIEEKDRVLLRKKIYGKNRDITTTSSYEIVEKNICNDNFCFNLL